jgi:hypothetical protein
VQAKPGGSPDRATWTLLSSLNAPFSPGSASSNPAGFNYGGGCGARRRERRPLRGARQGRAGGVGDAGPGIIVTGAFKAVSKAGVAQGTWTQPTEDLIVNTIAGPFGRTWNAGGSIFTWT